ncbi:hypothetical protein LBMAG48_27350 [Phycisphaerae bacterium]|nr:hypothetical protein LBMAG48_27350 [Phycisphaerae bacterium]
MTVKSRHCNARGKRESVPLPRRGRCLLCVSLPRVALRSLVSDLRCTRGYIPAPRWGLLKSLWRLLKSVWGLFEALWGLFEPLWCYFALLWGGGNCLSGALAASRSLRLLRRRAIAL